LKGNTYEWLNFLFNSPREKTIPSVENYHVKRAYELMGEVLKDKDLSV
jgi:hypothetical protein